VLKRIEVERADVGGRPVYEVSPRGISRDTLTGHVLYLHGGAYVLDLLPHFHWPAIAKLANTLRRNVTVPIYPIAPEHSYREVFPFLLQVYRRLLDTREPRSIAFMGDSAGGGMAFALCHAVRDAGLSQPSDAVLLSPWMHVALPDTRVPSVANIDPVLSLDDLRAAGIRYAGGDPLDTPLVSPSVGSLAGLPRLTVFTGTHDVLNPDARAFHERATAEGLSIGWYERPGAMHVWMFLPGGRGAEALAQICQVLSR
jgi:acetyl esterase/lipase